MIFVSVHLSLSFMFLAEGKRQLHPRSVGEVNTLERLFFLVLEAATLFKVFHGGLVLGLGMIFNRLLIFKNFVDTEGATIVLVLKHVIPDAASLES